MVPAEQPLIPADLSQIRYLGDLQRLELKHGDRLVLTCDRLISSNEAEQIKRQFELFLPGVKVLVLDRGMSLGAVGQSEP